ncbi:MAG TPA: SbcC/MukB-like Walker B domain-containing protein [Ktedonosporobacter sp.]|nr:SbcC/MukB-like Walker B domain-containing protein [Ktedonosporobacter sp.]
MAHIIEKPTLWDESGEEAANIQAKLLQQVPDGPPGYRLRRIILTNFWLYEHQEFEIPHGRLFLAGDNRSGKSTVLTAAITLALDGDYRPERIDTFGKREKRIDYYIIGSNESNTPFIREQRTSYIALEFEWCDPDQPPFATELRTRWERGEYEQARFLTIGLAFYGNRNSASPITPLRFLITDGSRLESKAIATMQGSGATRRACDLKTFKKALAEHGIACETLREYEQKVAHYLFNFTDMDNFRRLIKQLLYLRQPNLNSVLSLEAVREYLDQALPALPADLIQHAATTLELMDSLQDEIERRKKAYGAVERLHRSQQIVTMAKARLAACEYIHDQFKANEVQSDVQRLKRTITRAEHDLKRYQTRIEELEREEIELEGQVKGLEGSEGLQAARRISQTQETVVKLEKDLNEQHQILDDAISRRERTDQIITTQRQVFEQMRQQSEQMLTTLQQLASQTARWQVAADQLTETLKQARELSLDAPSPNISTRISSLLEVPVQERLHWLRVLRRLHQDIEQATIRLQSAQTQETETYEALDEATRRFEYEREQVCMAQQALADQLDNLLDQSDWQTPFTQINERAALIWSETGTPQATVERLGTLLQEYSRAINQTLNEAMALLSHLQQRLEMLKGDQGAKREAVARAREAYEKKQQEPEYIPGRSAHRVQARERLEASGIAAIPLYMLLDFAPGIDSQGPIAGGIEHMLEDAGLLDALVVHPAHITTADALLTTEGLSDCRIDGEQLKASGKMGGGDGAHDKSAEVGGVVNAHDQSAEVPVNRPLQLDSAIRETFGEQAAGWEETVQDILNALESGAVGALFHQNLTDMGRTWRHGLLSGIAGEGTARCIGKATRIREQQRTLALLQQHWEALESELQAIDHQIEDLELQRQQQEALRNQLNTILKESAAEERQVELRSRFNLLTQAEGSYQEARSKAQAMRQQIGTLKIRLQKEAVDVPIFASAADTVNQAYDATHKLVSEHKMALSYLERLRAAWQEHKQAQEQLDRDKPAEWRAEQASQKAERAVVQARAELETLERLVRETEQVGIDSLLASIQKLQERQNSLPEELRKIREQRAKAEGTWEGSQDDYEGAQEAYAKAQQQCDETYQRFLVQFEAYPVEMLSAVKQRMSTKPRLDTAQDVLAEPLEANDDAYIQRKNTLEVHKNREENELFKLASEVNNLLHEYGPQYDDQGIIRFVNVERANSLELLTRLGEEIRQHEQLLEARERELFQNFLLEEMADTVGKHITEAEQWVDRMNAVLGQTAFVGEYYHLRWASRKQEQAQQGSRLAQYHDILRRQVQTFKQEEVDALVHAFRQEISALRTLSQGASDTTFAEALARIFDYRKWFQFEIYITRSDGTQQHLTNRFFKKGSGAEQYVTLYIPFFAALSALYESAGKGAPRLIALDEAFEKVSINHTKKLLKFLASQQFQWIMTGPRVTGEGADIPACVKYTMFCQKEEELAAGFPSFWSTDPSIAEE